MAEVLGESLGIHIQKLDLVRFYQKQKKDSKSFDLLPF